MLNTLKNNNLDKYMIDMDFKRFGQAISEMLTFKKVYNDITKTITKSFRSFAIGYNLKSNDKIYTYSKKDDATKEDYEKKYFSIFKYDKKYFKQKKILRAYVKIPYGCNFSQLATKKYELEDALGYNCELYRTSYDDVLCISINTNMGKFMYQFNKKFSKFMRALEIKNKLDETFKISSIKKSKDYAIYDVEINIPAGLSPDILIANLQKFQVFFRCVALFSYDRYEKKIKARIVAEDLTHYYYTPTPVPRNHLFLGYTIFHELATLDINEVGHVLLCGMTGTGKNVLLSTILTNIMYYAMNDDSFKDVEFYFFQCMKGELSLFADCKTSRGFYGELEEIAKKLEQLEKLVDERSNAMAKLGITKYEQFCKVFPNEFVKRKICVIDEFSFFHTKDSDKSSEDDLKRRCYKSIKSIINAGRAAGVNLITALQRPTADNITTSVRNQMAVITLALKSETDSAVALGEEKLGANKLKKRECMIAGNGVPPNLCAPNIIVVPLVESDNSTLKKFIPEIRTASLDNLDPEVYAERMKIVEAMFIKEKEFDSYCGIDEINTNDVKEPLSDINIEETDKAINDFSNYEQIKNNAYKESLVPTDEESVQISSFGYSKEVNQKPPTKTKNKKHKIPLK